MVLNEIGSNMAIYAAFWPKFSNFRYVAKISQELMNGFDKNFPIFRGPEGSDERDKVQDLGAIFYGNFRT